MKWSESGDDEMATWPLNVETLACSAYGSSDLRRVIKTSLYVNSYVELGKHCHCVRTSFP